MPGQRVAESDFTFTPSPKGLLLTRLESESHAPPSAPATHVVMNATYAPVDTFLLPQNVSFTVTNVASFAFKFVDCHVTR